MRKSRLLLVLPFAPLLGAACFSPGSGGNGPNTGFDSGITEFDGTADAEPDASPVEASADVGLEAAPIVDAPVDVPVEAAPQPITVVVAGNSGPESGIDVVWGDATGAVVGSPVQTTNGTAVTLLPNVTMATVLFGTAGNSSAYTIMGLQPGDTAYVADGSGPTPTVNVTALPASPPFDAGVVDQSLTIGGCSQYFPSGLPYTLPLSGFGPPCIGLQAMGSTFVPALPSLVQFYDASFNVLGFAYASQPLLALMPDDVGLLDYAITGSWSTATTQQLVDVVYPADASIPSVNLTYSELLDGVLTPVPQGAVPADAGPGAFTLATTHVGIAQAVQVEALVGNSGMGGENIAVVTRAPAPTASGTVTIDTSPIRILPTFTQGTISGSTQPVVSWTLASGDLSAATGVIAALSWRQPLDGGGFSGASWTIISPGTAASSLTAPQLPASLSGYAPAGSGAVLTAQQVAVVYGQTAMPTYASMLPIASMIRANPCSVQTPIMPPMPGAGTAMLLLFGIGTGC